MKKNASYNEEALSLFSTQVALIYESGMDLREGLSFLDTSDQIDLNQLKTNLKETGKLSLAMAQDPRFPKEAVLAMKAAETIGQEASVALHLAHYYQRQVETKSFLRDIMIMPLMLMIILILVMAVLTFVVIPVFQDVYESLGGSLDAWIQILLLISKGFVIIALGALVIVFVVVLITVIQGQLNKTPVDLSDKVLRLFPSRKYKADLAHFSFISQLVLKAGIQQQEAMTLAMAQVPLGQLRDKLNAKIKDLSPSQGLYDLLINTNIYPPLLQNTLTIAYKTGKTDEVMEHVSKKTHEDSESSLTALLNRIEPILILTLTGFVALVLFSLIIPLIGIMSSLG